MSTADKQLGRFLEIRTVLYGSETQAEGSDEPLECRLPISYLCTCVRFTETDRQINDTFRTSTQSRMLSAGPLIHTIRRSVSLTNQPKVLESFEILSLQPRVCLRDLGKNIFSLKNTSRLTTSVQKKLLIL